MTEENTTQSQTSSNKQTIQAGDQKMAKNQSKPVRGRSETIRILDENLDDSTEDEQETSDDITKEISDNIVKKLLLSDKCEPDCYADTMETGETAKKAEEVEEMKLLKEIAKRPLESFKNMKNVPDAIAKTYYKDIARRWKESEARIKEAENLLSSVKYEDRSLEEDRLEILGELLDKATQSFEIYEEHEVIELHSAIIKLKKKNRKVPYGHRIVLEVRLLMVFNNAVDLIYKIIGEFDKLKGDQIGVNDERDQLRYEIRYCDAVYTEVHERFLKSYLEMEW